MVTYVLATDAFPRMAPGLAFSVYCVMGAVAAVVFFFSLILHELGHSLVSQRCGIPVRRITLYIIGGLAEISREPDDAKSELKIALAGPIVSIILAVIYFLASLLFRTLDFVPVVAVCEWLAVINVSLVVFNMIPGYPLDGGRVLRALLWMRSGKLTRATFITSRIGIGFSWVIVFLGLWVVLVEKQPLGAVNFLIAIFLKGAADNGYASAVEKEVLGGITVRDIMTRQPICIPAAMPLNLAVDDYFLTNHHVAFPVSSEDGEFRGLLRLDFLRDVPREKWPYVTAGDLAAEKQTQELKLEAATSAARAMRLLLAPDSGRLAVTEKGQTVGMITRHDILHFVKIHTELGTA
jgi:Zn-dependent protease